MPADVSLNIVDRVRIASACTARWEDMIGDDKVRHCGECNLNVHNLSAMTRDEAEALLRSNFSSDGAPTSERMGGRMCGRWRRRADGTIIFGDCPVGLAKVRARARRSLIRVCAMLGLTTLLTAALARAQRAGWDPHKYTSFTIVSRWIGADGAIQTTNGAAAVAGRMVMGDVSIPVVSAPPAPLPPPLPPPVPALPPNTNPAKGLN